MNPVVRTLAIGMAAIVLPMAVAAASRADVDISNGGRETIEASDLSDGPVLVSDVSAGGGSCALTTTGAVLCWGERPETNSVYLEPAPVAGVQASVVDITSGWSHACALMTSGHVKCWGDNSSGQLGDGTRKDRNRPVEILTNVTVVSLSAGGDHTCALLKNGGIRCWGSNFAGMLGDGTTDNRYSPVPVIGLDQPAVSVSASSATTCATLANASMVCWGANHRGQLGDGTTENRHVPVTVKDLPGPVQLIAPGPDHTCASVSGEVYCWGDGGAGQLGNGRRVSSTNPVRVRGLSGSPVELVANYRFTCASTPDELVSCWGLNGDGQLGDGSAMVRALPVPVVYLGGPVTAMAAGTRHVCVALSDGAVRCWGDNYNSQIGDGTIENERPVAVTTWGLRGTDTTRHQPDVKVARDRDGSYRGNNSYSKTGVGQSVRFVAHQRKTVTFFIKAQNDGHRPDVIYLESDARYKWQYPVMTPRFFAGSTDITASMERGRQWSWEPASGDTTIKVKVTIAPRWIPRGGASFSIWATSAHNPRATDVVQVWALKHR